MIEINLHVYLHLFFAVDQAWHRYRRRTHAARRHVALPLSKLFPIVQTGAGRVFLVLGHFLACGKGLLHGALFVSCELKTRWGFPSRRPNLFCRGFDAGSFEEDRRLVVNL